jgi:hypothetical protein
LYTASTSVDRWIELGDGSDQQQGSRRVAELTRSVLSMHVMNKTDLAEISPPQAALYGLSFRRGKPNPGAKGSAAG